jgi:hypothetical protein
VVPALVHAARVQGAHLVKTIKKFSNENEKILDNFSLEVLNLRPILEHLG